MQNRLREIRKIKNMTISEVADKIDVSQPALTAWEKEDKTPSIDKIIKLSELYGVSIDYLLGRNTPDIYDANETIEKETLPILHGKPVYIDSIGWALVNAIESNFILISGDKISFDSVQKVYSHPYITSYTDKPLSYPDLLPGIEVLLEPISTDTSLCEQLRGCYKIFDTCAENSAGNKFMLDKYGFSWLAFPKK